MSKIEFILDVKLTQSEQKVIQFVAAGLTNRAIAERLNLSCRTVESHVFSMLSKTGFSNRTQLAYWAIENQLF